MCIMVDGPAEHRTHETSYPAQCAGHSVRQALFVKLGSRTNSPNYDLGLVASCDLGPGSEMFYFLDLSPSPGG